MLFTTKSFKYEWKKIYEPFDSNAADEVNRTAEEDIVEWKEKLGKEDDVDVAIHREWPWEH